MIIALNRFRHVHQERKPWISRHLVDKCSLFSAICEICAKTRHQMP